MGAEEGGLLQRFCLNCLGKVAAIEEADLVDVHFATDYGFGLGGVEALLLVVFVEPGLGQGAGVGHGSLQARTVVQAAADAVAVGVFGGIALGVAATDAAIGAIDGNQRSHEAILAVSAMGRQMPWGHVLYGLRKRAIAPWAIEKVVGFIGGGMGIPKIVRTFYRSKDNQCTNKESTLVCTIEGSIYTKWKTMPKTKHAQHGQKKVERIGVRVSPSAKEGLIELANELDLSLGELMEQIGRKQIPLSPLLGESLAN